MATKITIDTMTRIPTADNLGTAGLQFSVTYLETDDVLNTVLYRETFGHQFQFSPPLPLVVTAAEMQGRVVAFLKSNLVTDRMKASAGATKATSLPSNNVIVVPLDISGAV